MGNYWQGSGQPSDVTLNQIDAKELRITKLAVLKSAIEGNLIKKNKFLRNNMDGEVEVAGEETDEDFLERWIKWVYSNTEHDKKLTQTDSPF